MKQQGFSLIELTIVLVIMIAGAALVGPNISSGRGSSQIKAAARDFASALRYARGQSIISHEEVFVSLDLDNNEYQLSNREKIYQVNEEIEISLVTAQSEQTGEGQGNIRFFPDGSSTGGRITLASGDNEWLVDVNWLTGHVQLINE
jgi:general secretion pathway protein H